MKLFPDKRNTSRNKLSESAYLYHKMRASFSVLIFTSLTTGRLFSSSGEVFFEEKVRPLLAEHCLKCHSEEKKIKGGLLLDRKAGWEKGGDSGPVIIPGKPAESLLIAMVKHDPGVESMPPKSKLNEEELATLEQWIDMGAPDPRSQAIGAKALESEFDLEARKSWWSLQPVKSYNPPNVSNQDWPRNDIDRFILAQLDKKEWQPAPAADKLTLFRRASVVLTGLAPTMAELEAFEKDADPGAYERAVERMLSSPHFGEHWARQWMDLIRYGESKGFEQDFYMPHMYQYRDYLIRAFNADLPYDQFVRESFAGDQLENPRLHPETGFNESIIGPGFLTITDGQHGPPDLAGDEARMIDGTIKAVGAAFHGLTITCARCHDHKFDAITDEDYYSLYGIIRSSRMNYSNIAATTHKPEIISLLESAHAEAIKTTFSASFDSIATFLTEVQAILTSEKMVAFKKSLEGLDQTKRNKAHQKLREDLASSHSPLHAAWLLQAISGREPELTGLRHWLVHEKTPPAGNDHPKSKPLHWQANGEGFRELKQPSFIIDSSIKSGIGSGFVAGDLSARLDGALRSEEFTLDGENVSIWVKGRGATANLRIRNYELVGSGPTTRVLRKQVETDDWQYLTFPTNLWKGETAYFEVVQNGWAKRFTSPREGQPAPSDHAYVAFTQQPPNWNSVWTGQGDLLTNLTALLDRAQSGKLNPADAEVIAALFRTGLLTGTADRQKLNDLRQKIAIPVYARSLVDGHSYQQPIFIRGNHKKPSTKENPRHFLDGLGGEMISATGSGRRDWAEHLLSPDNPLTARVRVNQLWARVFGRGIVSSVDDFGEMGTLPSHPELLDFLAQDFIQEGWSMKAMIRKMVLSQTFRMSSVPSESARQLDPENSLLQRMPVRRMEAESLRDHLLACSDELKKDLFGPAVNAYVKDQPGSRAKPGDGPLNGNGRRSLYLAVRRNFLSSFLTSFDFPVLPEPVAARPSTTVPAQSLVLLNHPLVHEQSLKWAEKTLKKEASPEERINHLHRQAFSRNATEPELTWAKNALAQFSAEHNQSELEAWTALCHLMFNRKEFLYVF